MAVDRFGEVLLDQAVLREHLVEVAGENAWQQRARLLQSLWRQDHGWAPGFRSHDYADRSADGQVPTERLGSRLTPEIAETGANFLTEAAWDRAQFELANLESGAVMKRSRLLHDLLSSQPLCFSAFADLDTDHALATRVLAELLPAHGITGLTPRADGRAIRFEHSPGRGRPDYGGDRSAFDVAIGIETTGGPGLLGIEVKYHENLAQPDHNAPDFTGWFPDVTEGDQSILLKPPLVQLARDHRLARAVAAADRSTFPAGVTWVLLYPGGNTAVARAFAAYQSLLPTATDLAAVTLEAFADTCERGTTQSWPAQLRARYLDTDRATALGQSTEGSSYGASN